MKQKAKRIIFYIQDYLDKRRARAMVAKLHSLSKTNWIEIAHTFNKWEFPMEFIQFIPSWYMKSGRRNTNRKMAIISPLMSVVKTEFGEKEQLRYHNVIKGKMTDMEFDHWYKITRENNETEIRKYYDRKTAIENLHWWEDEVFYRPYRTINENPVRT